MFGLFLQKREQKLVRLLMMQLLKITNFLNEIVRRDRV